MAGLLSAGNTIDIINYMTFLLSRARVCLLTICQMLLLATSFTYTNAGAQTLDFEPPRIGADASTEVFRGEPQVFTVTATDNAGVDSLVIYYRLGVDAEYVSGRMQRIGGTDLFSFTIPADSIPATVNVIQYYIEASDFEGNRTLEGFSFSPVERILLDEPASVAGSDSRQSGESSSLLGSLSTTQKVVYGAVGLVIVGALVAVASDSGGGSGSSDQTVPTTIVVDQ